MALACQIKDECLRTLGMENVNITISWARRYTRKMGTAETVGIGGRVRLSMPLWPNASEAERRNTVVHEVCHILTRVRYGPQIDRGGRRISHGWRWQSLMIACGERPNRTHNVSRVGVVNEYVLICPKCGQEIAIGARLRNKWVRSQRTRVCMRCRAKLPWELAQGARRKTA